MLITFMFKDKSYFSIFFNMNRTLNNLKIKLSFQKDGIKPKKNL